MTKKIIKALDLNLSADMVDESALSVIKKLQKNHYQAYIVGGGVRDLLLKMKPKDFDIVTDATPEEIRRLFRNSIIIGRRFKIVHIYFEKFNEERSEKLGKRMFDRYIIEVSTFRSNNKEHQSVISEHGRILVDNNYGSIDEDAQRRDFTVNALYYDPIKELIVDYHNGVKDLNARLIQMIGNPRDRYIEDPVRILRAIRIALKLGLEIADKTYINFQQAKHLLANEPRGRLFEEMLKILRSGNSQAIINELEELKLPHMVFPIFEKLFFGENPDNISIRIIEKTDERISRGEEVSTIYILSGLFWNYIYKLWEDELSFNSNHKQALMDVVARDKNFIYSSGVTRNVYALMREIWLLQIDFEYPNLKRLDHTLEHPRFRQALHLFNLRAEVGQVNLEVHTWWDNYLLANENEKIQLQIGLVDLVPQANKKRKKRKYSRRKTAQIH